MSLPDLQRKYALSGGANTDVLMQCFELLLGLDKIL